MESQMDQATALALLEWQMELGADEAIGDAPVNRYELAAKPAPVKTTAAGPAPQPSTSVDVVAVAREAAAGVADLGALQATLAAFEHCELKRGARNLVFSDGQPEARVMIIGEAPGRDEDRVGKPFVGRAGQLLNLMFDAIGLGREKPVDQAFYITNVLPWRPPQNRDPKPDEIAMMLPFVQRHVDLVDPDLVVLMGNISCQAGLGKRGITRLRGTWAEAYGKPALPMFHPAYLLRNPQAKREAWADLLTLRARLDG
ncbi:MAG: uracil-DNA glycosylase [Pseudomonadota bacterium]